MTIDVNAGKRVLSRLKEHVLRNAPTEAHIKDTFQVTKSKLVHALFLSQFVGSVNFENLIKILKDERIL